MAIADAGVRYFFCRQSVKYIVFARARTECIGSSHFHHELAHWLHDRASPPSELPLLPSDATDSAAACLAAARSTPSACSSANTVGAIAVAPAAFAIALPLLLFPNLAAPPLEDDDDNDDDADAEDDADDDTGAVAACPAAPAAHAGSNTRRR